MSNTFDSNIFSFSCENERQLREEVALAQREAADGAPNKSNLMNKILAMIETLWRTFPSEESADNILNNLCYNRITEEMAYWSLIAIVE